MAQMLHKMSPITVSDAVAHTSYG